MVSFKPPLLNLSLLLPLQLCSLTGLATLVMPSAIAQSIPDRWNTHEYQPPADIGTLGRRDTGGTRGDMSQCPVRQLKAVTPTNSFAVTVQPYPTFFFYVPRQLSQAPQAEFVLQDDQDHELYKSTFKMTEKSNLVRMSIPDTAGLPPLQIGKDYRWSLTVICNPTDDEKNLVVYGVIRRVPLSAGLNAQLMQTAPEQRADVYASAHIWQDALTTLADLRHARPHDLTIEEQWRKLLNSVDLREVANETF